MDQDESNLEEGEIVDEVVYEPLKRPETYAMDIPLKRFPEIDTAYSDSEEEQCSTESDSDSDSSSNKTKKKPKRVKLIPKLPSQRPADKLKKYDIWSTRAQEDVLAETMISCDVTLKDRSRQSENYDFTFASKYYAEMEGRQGTKRTREDMKNKNFTQKKSEEEFKDKPKEICDLLVNEHSEVQDIVRDIAEKLGEERSDLILKVVEIMGKERAIKFFKETQLIEKEGGMPILNQTRRRTPGGVFLYLVRSDYHITPEQRRQIFSDEIQKNNKLIKEKKKKKLQELKANTNLVRNKILPELLTRAELLAKENPVRTLKKTGEDNCTNPPPSPETDHQESGDGMESHLPININNSLEGRAELKYDDDVLDITCEDNMDLF